jgi:hypothetical protein
MRSVAAAIVGAAVIICPVFGSTFMAQVFPSTLSSSVALCNFQNQGFDSGTACAGASVGVMGSAGQPGGSSAGVFTEANTNISDLIFSGPGTSVTATVTIPFTSIILEDFQAWPAGPSGAGARIAFGVTFGQYQGGVGIGTDGDTYTPSVTSGTGWSFSVVPTFGITLLTCCNPPQIGSEHSNSFQFNGSLTFTQTFPVGVVIPVVFDVQGQCSAAGLNQDAFPSDCQFDALDPFGFVAGFSSFNLPPGYSVDAPSIGLVNGQIPSSAAPEPGAMVLLGPGCAILLAGRFLKSRLSRRS